MEDQIKYVLHWSHQKEPEQAKTKDEVIRRILNRTQVAKSSDLSIIREHPGVPQGLGNMCVKFLLDLSSHSRDDF